MIPRPIKLASRKANNATAIAAMNGEIRRRYSGQDGRKIAMAATGGANRTNKAGRDRHRSRT
jgi:hypothetical protein